MILKYQWIFLWDLQDMNLSPCGDSNQKEDGSMFTPSELKPAYRSTRSTVRDSTIDRRSEVISDIQPFSLAQLAPGATDHTHTLYLSPASRITIQPGRSHMTTTPQ